MDAGTRMEIRFVKYQDYIARHPDNPYGHYCLGVLKHQAGRHAQAVASLKTALQLKEDYTPAILEWISILLDQSSYKAAARLYNKNRHLFRKFRIYRVKLHRLLGALYTQAGSVKEGFRGFFGWLRQGTRPLERLYNGSRLVRRSGRFAALYNGSRLVRRSGGFAALYNGSRLVRRSGRFAALFDTDPVNPVVNILLAIQYLRQGSDSPRALSLYHLCHDLEGLPDSLRWNLLQQLSKAQPGLLEDEGVLSLFEAVPGNVTEPEQANRMLKYFLSVGCADSIMASVQTMQDGHVVVSNRNQWRFVQFCVETGRTDKMLVICLKSLISQGWVDPVLARAATMLFGAGMLARAGDVNHILTLYGYGTTA